MKLITIIVILFSISSISLASLDKVEKAIKQKGAKWRAGETSISRLSEHEQRQLCSVIIDHVDTANAAPGKKPKLPQRWDWRDVEGQSWVTPVKSQGGCGSCWAFGCVAQLESVKMISEGIPDPDLDLSEQYQVSCDPNNFGCSGGYMYPAYNFIRDVGVPPEDCFPYAGRDLPCEEACLDPELVSVDSWSRISYSVTWLKERTYEHPVTCAFYVYQDFFYYTGGIYKYVWGDLRGGHAVCIVGWDNRGFIVKNSWGDGWGEDGYFRIAFSESSSKSEVCFGMQAGRFFIDSSQAPGRNGTVISVWAGMKAQL